MDPSIWIVLISFALILWVFSLLRRRGGPDKYPEVVQNLLYDIKVNQALVETFREREKPKTFEKTNWELNKTKIGFLPETQKEMLKEIFRLVDEFNVEIKASKKNKTDSYKSLDLTRFKELLDKSREELEDWMMTKIGRKDLPPKYPSIWTFFTGER